MSTQHKPQSAFFRRIMQIGLFGLLPFIGLIVLLLAAGSGQVSSAPTEPSVPLVEFAAITIQDQYIAKRRVIGRIEAASQSVLGFELGGTLEQTLVDEGQHVVTGQPLAQLDTARLEAQVSQLKAALARAESNERLARLSEKRVVELVRQKLESPQRLDEVRENTVSASATVLETQAQITEVEVQLEKSVLKSPFSGKILDRLVDNGSVVGQGQSIFVIQQSDELQARIAMGTDDARMFVLSQQVTLYNGQQPLLATVTSIAANRRLATQTVDVVFTLEDSEYQTLSGDLVSLQLNLPVDERGAWVSRQALSSGVRGLWTLYIVESAEGKDHVTPRSVEVLYSFKDKVFIRGPVRNGERYVVAGSHKLTPDQIVNVRLAETKHVASIGGH
jgi:RND family efflux transporter MFP subunit